MNEVKQYIKSVVEWVSVQPIRLVCLTLFGCVMVVALSSCTAFSCKQMAESEQARYKYHSETSKEFWKNK